MYWARRLTLPPTGDGHDEGTDQRRGIGHAAPPDRRQPIARQSEDERVHGQVAPEAPTARRERPGIGEHDSDDEDGTESGDRHQRRRPPVAPARDAEPDRASRQEEAYQRARQGGGGGRRSRDREPPPLHRQHAGQAERHAHREGDSPHDEVRHRRQREPCRADTGTSTERLGDDPVEEERGDDPAHRGERDRADQSAERRHDDRVAEGGMAREPLVVPDREAVVVHQIASIHRAGGRPRIRARRRPPTPTPRLSPIGACPTMLCRRRPDGLHRPGSFPSPAIPPLARHRGNGAPRHLVLEAVAVKRASMTSVPLAFVCTVNDVGQ